MNLQRGRLATKLVNDVGDPFVLQRQQVKQPPTGGRRTLAADDRQCSAR